jgi:hypothetical protein
MGHLLQVRRVLCPIYILVHATGIDIAKIPRTCVTSTGPQHLQSVSIGLAAKMGKTRKNIVEEELVLGYNSSAA